MGALFNSEVGMVAATKSQVFLVQGQMVMKVNGVDKYSPVIESCVVVAQDHVAAYSHLETVMPTFKPVGHASLQEYEDAASKLRSALKGEDVGCKVFVAAGMGD